MQETFYKRAFPLWCMSPTVHVKTVKGLLKHMYPRQSQAINHTEVSKLELHVLYCAFFRSNLFFVLADVRKKLLEIKKRFNVRCKAVLSESGLLKTSLAQSAENSNPNPMETSPLELLSTLYVFEEVGP